MLKETIASAVVVAVEEIVKPLHTEISSLKVEVAHLKLKLANVEAQMMLPSKCHDQWLASLAWQY